MMKQMKPLFNTETETETEINLDELTITAEGISAGNEKLLILWNDDVNSFDHVIQSLVEICKHSFHQAHQCALIVHNNGKCEIKKGSLDMLKPMKEALTDRKLSVDIN